MTLEVKMWLLLLACSPDDFTEMDDGTAFLGDVSDIPERTRLSSYGTARFTEAGEDLTNPEFGVVWGQDELVVVEVGDRVRVHWAQSETELLLWLDRPDLVDVLHSRAWGRGRSDETGAEFPAGLAVTWEEGRPIADLGGRYLHARLVVPNGAVDQVYTPVDIPEDAEGAVYLRTATEILDVPGGDPIAETRDYGDGFLVPATRVRESGGWTLIDAWDRDLRVRGWVTADRVAGHANMGVGGCGCCGGVGSRHGRAGWLGEVVTLPAGTLLHDGPGGPVVGRILADRDVRGPLVAGEVTFSQHTPWGTAELTASPTAILPVEDPEVWTE